MSDECFFCHEQNKTVSPFDCNHTICSECLYRHIFCYYIQEINNSDTLTINCKCPQPGTLTLDMPKLHNLLANLEENEEEKVETCKFHISNNILDTFCKECEKKICFNCHTSSKEAHYGHRVEEIATLTRKMKDYLKDFIGTIPIQKNVFDIRINMYSKAIKDIVDVNFKETMETITTLIESLQAFQKEYVENYTREMKRIVYNLKVLDMFYTRFYADLQDIDKGDVFFLKYINNMGCLFNNLVIEQRTETNNMLSNMKVQLDELRKNRSFFDAEFSYQDISREFRFRNMATTPHTSLIQAIIQLSDDRLVTGASDGILIWEEKEMGYVNTIKVSLFAKDINALLALKDKKFASGGAKKDICIFAATAKDCSPKQTLSGHNDSITSLASLKDGRMISAAKDKTFIIWNEVGNEFEQAQLFEESDLIFNIIPLYDNRLIISTKSSINLWKESNKKYKLIHTFKMKRSSSELIQTVCQLRDSRIALGGRAKIIYIFEAKEANVYTIKQQINDAHEGYINSIVELTKGQLASSSADHFIKIWEKNANSHEYQVTNSVDYPHGLFCLIQLRDGTLCSTSTKQTIVFYKDRSDYS